MYKLKYIKGISETNAWFEERGNTIEVVSVEYSTIDSGPVYLILYKELDVN